MTYTLFHVILGLISLVLFCLGLALVDRSRNLGNFLAWLFGVLCLWCMIGAPLVYEISYDDFQDPVCLESQGYAPITFVWNQDEPGVYIDDKPYLLKNHLRNYEEQIKELEASWEHDSIPRVDSLEVFRYKYPRFLGFIKATRKSYILVHKPDNYVIYGNCRQRLNQLQTK